MGRLGVLFHSGGGGALTGCSGPPIRGCLWANPSSYSWGWPLFWRGALLPSWECACSGPLCVLLVAAASSPGGMCAVGLGWPLVSLPLGWVAAPAAGSPFSSSQRLLGSLRASGHVLLVGTCQSFGLDVRSHLETDLKSGATSW